MVFFWLAIEDVNHPMSFCLSCAKLSAELRPQRRFHPLPRRRHGRAATHRRQRLQQAKRRDSRTAPGVAQHGARWAWEWPKYIYIIIIISYIYIRIDIYLYVYIFVIYWFIYLFIYIYFIYLIYLFNSILFVYLFKY